MKLNFVLMSFTQLYNRSFRVVDWTGTGCCEYSKLKNIRAERMRAK